MKNYSLIRLIVVIVFTALIFILMFLKFYSKEDVEVTEIVDLLFNKILGVGSVLLVIFLGYMMTRENQTNH